MGMNETQYCRFEMKREMSIDKRTVVRNDLWHFVNPLIVPFDNVTDIRNVEGIFWLFRINYILNNVHVTRIIVGDIYLVEIVRHEDGPMRSFSV